MIAEAFTIIGIIGILSMMTIKIYGIVKNLKEVDKGTALITAFVAVIFWALVFFSFITSIGYQSDATIVNGASTISVVQKDNYYITAATFMDLANSFMLIIIGLTAVELIFSFANNEITRFVPKKYEV